MIVPTYWAEARTQRREQNRQVTVRRFGWSDESHAAAQAHAEVRAAEALEAIWCGNKALLRREPKLAYNGAQGTPIREEIIARQGQAVVTRNAYGAHCLNTPDVLFADIDFPDKPALRYSLVLFGILIAITVASYWIAQWRWVGVFLGVVAVLASGPLTTAAYRAVLAARGGAEKVARSRLTEFAAQRPQWNFHLYRTPAGFRAVATHQLFDPADPAVANCFAQLRVDPVYALMCRNQQCFRARVSAKPWRIGIGAHMRPRPGVWPVAPERMGVRRAWVEQYEARASAFAACRFIESIGSGSVHADVRPVLEWHDALSGARTERPLA